MQVKNAKEDAMTSRLKAVYQLMPGPAQSLARRVFNIWIGSPLTAAGRRERWIRDVYSAFGQEERQRIFLSIARFLHINRPIPGYYFEFGCNEGNTMRMAWDTFHRLFDLTYVGFDSFEGLPEIAEIDKQEIWAKGKLAYPQDRFVDVVTANGTPTDKLVTVKGFYDESLTDALKVKLGPKKAAVIYIDCDLYTSTVPVLNWIVDFLQKGTVIVFDDWNCFHGDPNLGERRAWREFRERNPHLRFEKFVATAEAQSFVYLGDLAPNSPAA